MSSFDKFVEDLEKRQAAKIRLNHLKQLETPQSTKARVFLYAERWQNCIKYSDPGRKK